eukprot:gene1473-862_t
MWILLFRRVVKVSGDKEKEEVVVRYRKVGWRALEWIQRIRLTKPLPLSHANTHTHNSSFLSPVLPETDSEDFLKISLLIVLYSPYSLLASLVCISSFPLPLLAFDPINSKPTWKQRSSASEASRHRIIRPTLEMNFDNFFKGGNAGSSPDLIVPTMQTTSSNNNGRGVIGGYWEKLSRDTRGFFGVEVPPEDEPLMDLPDSQGYTASLGEMLELTYSQRLSAFFMALGMGLVFILIALSAGTAMILVAPKKFAFFLTIGNLFCLFSTTFLVGVSYQLRTMFSAHRLQAAVLYIGAVVLTFYFSVVRPFGLACLVLAVVQVGRNDFQLGGHDAAASGLSYCDVLLLLTFFLEAGRNLSGREVLHSK